MTMKKFRALPLKKKIDYLVFDFSWQVFLGAFLLLILGTWIYLDYMVEAPVLSVEMFDGSPDSANQEAFSSFMEANGMVCTEENVKLSKKIQIGDQPGELSCRLESLIFCKAAEGKTDLYFWNDQDVEQALALFDLVDLRTVLPTEVLMACEDRLIYTGPLLDGGFPCAIRLKDCSWVEENGFYQDCAVGISRNTQNPQLVSDFIQYII